MITLIVVSILFLLVALVLTIGLMLTWALSGAEEDDAEDKRSPGKLRRFLTRFWSWANAVPPRLEYRRDKKGRFRKIRRG